TIAPRPPPAQALARPETLVSGRNRARACGVGGSCAGRAAAGEAGAANVEALAAGLRRGHVVSGHALALRKVCRAGFAGRGTPWALCTGRHSRRPSPTRDGVSGRGTSVVSARWLVARASSREPRRASAATTDEAYQTHAALRAAAAGAREERARPPQAPDRRSQ